MQLVQDKGFHTVTKDKKDRDVVLKELQTHAIFKVLSGRCHSSFRHIDSGILAK